MVCRLAVEMAKGSSSKWAGYIQHLPTEFDTLGYWSEDELAELQNEQLAYEAGNIHATNLHTYMRLPSNPSWLLLASAEPFMKALAGPGACC